MSRSASQAPARVVVLTKSDCHLCDVACEVVATVCDSLDVTYRFDDLAAADAATRQRWKDYVPVISVDGTVHDVFRVDAARLRSTLTATPSR